ncbi:MAG: hypothetical protein K2W95_15390 [Candidatus Obscuribacterales bacterium]|nr:hypothetical protein [Candidatus Obscuribacterales bacterium]
MKSLLRVGLALAGLALCVGLFLFLALVLDSSGRGFQSAIQPGDADAEFGNDYRTVTKPMSREDDFLFKERVCYPDGSPRIVKTVYDNRMPHLVRGDVPDVLYEYFRADGTLERDLLVEPEAGLGGGVYCKYRKRFFDVDGKTPLKEQYIRADGTLGVDIDQLKDIFTVYRADGKTLRFVQERYPNGKTRQTQYRLDGKTVWWVNGDATTKVFFDRNGNSVNKEFTWHSLGFSDYPKPGEPSVPRCEHRYIRSDGTAEYTQSWHTVHDNGVYFDALAQVDVYAADGKAIVARIHLKAQHPDKGRCITKVELFNADGTRLVRTYRIAGIRLEEESFDADGKSIKKESFPATDKYSEAFEEIIFQGFGGLNYHGEYDTDRYDN